MKTKPCTECADKQAKLGRGAERISHLRRVSFEQAERIRELELINQVISGERNQLRGQIIEVRAQLVASEREVATLRGCNDSALTTLVQLAHGIKFGPPADWEPKP